MALDTFANLQTALADHIGSRADVTSGTILDFITLAEGRFRRHLKTRPMVTRNAAFSITGAYVNVPTAFAGAISFSLTDQTPIVHLEAVSPERLNELLQDVYTATGTPAVYAVVGGEFGFAPTPSATFTAQLVYYLGVPALSVSATTNWLLTNHPDVYLYGALSEAGIYLVDDPRTPVWERRCLTALGELSDASLAESFGGRLSVGEFRVA